MTHDASPRAWLPSHCLTSRKAAEPFERAVDAWSEKWFATGGWRVLGCWDAPGQPDGGDWTVLRDTDSFAIKGRAKAVQTLALALLGQVEQPRYTPHDLRLMRRLGSTALDDLQASIEQLLRRPARSESASGASGDERLSLLIGQVGQAQLMIECVREDVVRIVRRGFSSLLPAGGLADRKRAADDEALAIAAHLGTARISVDEFARLEVGDIIVLDRAMDDFAILTIADRPTDLPVKIGAADGRVTFELMETT